MFEAIADFVCLNLLRLEVGSALCSSVNFFVYDVLKIAFSILVIITIISFLRTYVSPKQIKATLSKARFGLGHLIAACFGAISPFCSCSSIPIFIGFIKAGTPMGVAFSFLITSPLVNEIVFVLMIGTFGLKTALLYAAFGILLGVAGGMILQRLGLESDVLRLEENTDDLEMPTKLKDKLVFAWAETKYTFLKIFPFIILGVTIGAIIHGFIPTELIAQYIRSESIFAVPVAVAMGVPLYLGCSMLVPIVFAFTQKGIALGTALAFMMATAGLSFPEAIILKSTMKMRLLVIFFSIVAVGIIMVGYLFNWLF